MKLTKLALFAILLPFTGCSTVSGPITSAQALAIAEPVLSAGLTLVLDNQNASYTAIAKQVGADLSTSNWADLTTSGITAAVNASVAKFGGTPQEASIVGAALSVGLGAYLAEVSETSLSNDPNAILVLQALGSAISTAAANATPKG